MATEYSDFDASKHHPVFYGRMHAAISTDTAAAGELDPASSHPASLGYAFTEKPPKPPTPPAPAPPDVKKCKSKCFLKVHAYM